MTAAKAILVLFALALITHTVVGVSISDAKSLLSRSRLSLNVAAGNKTNATSGQNASLANNSTRMGLETFIISEHGRFTQQKDEISTFWSDAGAEMNTSIARLEKEKATLEDKAVQINVTHQEARATVLKALQEIDLLGKEITAAKAKIAAHEEAKQKADIHWNQTYSFEEKQRDATESSLKMLLDIEKHLSGPKPLSSIAELLKTRQADAENDRLDSLVQLAIKAQNKEDKVVSVSHFRDLLKTLKEEMEDHLGDLDENLIVIKESHKSHMLKMQEEIDGFKSELDTAEEEQKANKDALPLLDANVTNTHNPIIPVQQRLSEIETELAALKKTYDIEHTVEQRQAENVKTRIRTLELLESAVRELLLSGKTAIIARLRAVKDMLPEPSKNASLFDDIGKKPQEFHSRPLDPDELRQDSCGSWQFDEADGYPYALDTSPLSQDGKLHGMSNLRLRPGHKKDDKKGAALVFDGMDDFVDLGRLGNLGEELGSFSISVWVRTLDTHPALSSILKYIDEGVGGVLSIEANRRVGAEGTEGQQYSSDLSFESGSLLFYLRDARGRVLAGSIKPPNFFDNKWHHLQWTVKDAGENSMSVFVDGVHFPFAATIEQSPSRFNKLRSSLYVGAGNNRGTPEGFFDGAIDNLQIFCDPTAPLYGKKCCKVCRAGKACGNDCIPRTQECSNSGGCACNFDEVDDRTFQIKYNGTNATASSNNTKPIAGGSSNSTDNSESAVSESETETTPIDSSDEVDSTSGDDPAEEEEETPPADEESEESSGSEEDDEVEVPVSSTNETPSEEAEEILGGGDKKDPTTESDSEEVADATTADESSEESSTDDTTGGPVDSEESLNTAPPVTDDASEDAEQDTGSSSDAGGSEETEDEIVDDTEAST